MKSKTLKSPTAIYCRGPFKDVNKTGKFPTQTQIEGIVMSKKCRNDRTRDAKSAHFNLSYRPANNKSATATMPDFGELGTRNMRFLTPTTTAKPNRCVTQPDLFFSQVELKQQMQKLKKNAQGSNFTIAHVVRPEFNPETTNKNDFNLASDDTKAREGQGKNLTRIMQKTNFKVGFTKLDYQTVARQIEADQKVQIKKIQETKNQRESAKSANDRKTDSDVTKKPISELQEKINKTKTAQFRFGTDQVLYETLNKYMHDTKALSSEAAKERILHGEKISKNNVSLGTDNARVKQNYFSASTGGKNAPGLPTSLQAQSADYGRQPLVIKHTGTGSLLEQDRLHSMNQSMAIKAGNLPPPVYRYRSFQRNSPTISSYQAAKTQTYRPAAGAGLSGTPTKPSGAANFQFGREGSASKNQDYSTSNTNTNDAMMSQKVHTKEIKVAGGNPVEKSFTGPNMFEIPKPISTDIQKQQQQTHFQFGPNNISKASTKSSLLKSIQEKDELHASSKVASPRKPFTPKSGQVLKPYHTIVYPQGRETQLDANTEAKQQFKFSAQTQVQSKQNHTVTRDEINVLKAPNFQMNDGIAGNKTQNFYASQTRLASSPDKAFNFAQRVQNQISSLEKPTAAAGAKIQGLTYEQAQELVTANAKKLRGMMVKDGGDTHFQVGFYQENKLRASRDNVPRVLTPEQQNRTLLIKSPTSEMLPQAQPHSTLQAKVSQSQANLRASLWTGSNRTQSFRNVYHRLRTANNVNGDAKGIESTQQLQNPTSVNVYLGGDVNARHQTSNQQFFRWIQPKLV